MLRLGIVDFDSSHSVEFTQRFNHHVVDRDQWVEEARVTLGCPGASELSPERVPGFTTQVAACGVELVERPDEMIGRIDGVLVLSVCGTPHLERVRPFLEAGLPAYVDKPFACTLADALEMQRLAEAHGTIVFSSSSLRYSDDVIAFHQRRDLGQVHGVVVWGPAKRHPLNPGLFHYGIHAVETLFALMGPGCRQVSVACTECAEVATGTWSDGRLGVVRGTRSGSTAYGALAFCDAGVVPVSISSRYAYRNLCQAIIAALTTRTAPVPSDVTLEIVRFILAASQSERTGGVPVGLEGNDE